MIEEPGTCDDRVQHDIAGAAARPLLTRLTGQEAALCPATRGYRVEPPPYRHRSQDMGRLLGLYSLLALMQHVVRILHQLVDRLPIFGVHGDPGPEAQRWLLRLPARAALRQAV